MSLVIPITPGEMSILAAVLFYGLLNDRS